jgi:hypothetical protein
MKIVVTDELLDHLAEQYKKSNYVFVVDFDNYLKVCVSIMENNLIK